MNLERQPEWISKVIKETLDHELVHHGKFSLFQFSRFCGKYGLKQIAEQSEQYAQLFSVTGRNSPHKAETEAVAVAKKKALIEF